MLKAKKNQIWQLPSLHTCAASDTAEPSRRKRRTVPASYQTKADNGESLDFIRSGPFTVASVKFIKNKLVSFDSFAKIYYNKKATAYRLRFRKGRSRIFFRERGRNEGTHKMEVYVPDRTLHHVGFGNLLEPFL